MVIKVIIIYQHLKSKRKWKKRDILVNDAQSQSRFKLHTDVETFGELKELLLEKGINLDNVTVTEGISKTSFVSDGSLLPKDQLYKGRKTNELLILITPNKKIKLGLSRQDVLKHIKNEGLQGVIKEHFGKNYTNVSTAELVEFLADNQEKEEKKAKYTVSKVTCVLTEKLLEIGAEIAKLAALVEISYRKAMKEGEPEDCKSTKVSPLETKGGLSEEDLDEAFENME